MVRRLKLHEELCELLGSRNVYFQPPPSIHMRYPCIKYSQVGITLKRANNQVYKSVDRYELIVIDTNPDCDIPDRILRHFKNCSFDRSYVADNLYHKVLTLYF